MRHLVSCIDNKLRIHLVNLFAICPLTFSCLCISNAKCLTGSILDLLDATTKQGIRRYSRSQNIFT